MNNIYLQIPDLFSGNQDIVLATVTGKDGSTPQEPGSSAIFSKNGLLEGTIGGGIVEGKIQKAAEKAIQSRKSNHFEFNLGNDISDKEAAICGGQIRILVDAEVGNSISVFEQIIQSMAEKTPGVLVTMLTGGNETLVSVNRYWLSGGGTISIPHEYIERIKPVADDLLIKGLRSEYTRMEFSIPGEETTTLFLLEPIFPPEQLVIAGAGHIGRALTHLGNLLDFEVTVIDDRPEYANYENIKEASHIIVKDIGEAMQEISKSNDTYVVIVTRGHKDDAAALKPCIGSDLAYTGMIGSRKKINAMRSDFLMKGWATDTQWGKIHAPVGLDIKSQTVEEIAMSIAAQLVLVRNSKKHEKLRNPESTA